MAALPGLTTIRDTTTGNVDQPLSIKELMELFEAAKNPNRQSDPEVGYSNQTGADDLGLYAESSPMDRSFFDKFVDDIINDGNSNEDTGFLDSHSVSARAVFGTLYTIIAVMSLLGNSLVCLVVVRNKRMRSVTNFFLTNQALSDMLMTILNIPFIAYSQLVANWPFGSIVCHLTDFSGMTSVYVSTFMLTAIALDRHRVIIHPLRPRITMRTAIAIDILIWIISLSLSLPFGIYRQIVPRPSNPSQELCVANYPEENFITYFALATFISQYVIPLSLTSGAYLRIGMKLWAQAAVGDTIAQQQAANNRAKQRTTRMLVLVVAVFAVCWFPINTYLIIIKFIPDRKNSILYLWLHWFAMCSVCINPVAFAFLNENFRSELKATFHCWFLKVNLKRNRKCFGRSTDGNDTSHTMERPTNGLTRYESVTTRTTTGLCNGRSSDPCEAYQMEVKLTTSACADDNAEEVKEYEV